MVLDNGLHSITTPFKPLRQESSLEQEFELVVGTNLEFILTCKAKWPKPVSSPLLDNVSVAPSTRSLTSTASITSNARSEKSRSGFSKLFGKKKAIAHDSIRPVPSGRSIMSHAPAAPQIKRDTWEDLTAVDGSFGRIYVALSQYENEIYGRAATFEIPLYNEWSINHISLSGVGKKVKKEPYQIGTLQVQMMFVPRASKSEELPGSIKEALNDLRHAVKTRERSSKPVVIDDDDGEEEEIKLSGYLSQLGGDCKYWRRRFFVLNDTTLTAYSETSHKPRAVVNLKKAIRIIQDKDTLIKPSSDKRRKSGFAENEDAYMFADQGFRISFLNGEVIEFYGDNKADWVKCLNKVIDTKDLLLAREKKLKEKIQQDQNDLAKEKPWVGLVLDSKA
ncbi:hypothetical protein D0Z00_003474 [Geotrichum galactomycetum]|uniref:Uncharacterized protein n=1 Tax=Geotrichum galactomycetum TaxID=27317 RepID=A0ACB6V180_9ASCO|nr:hypothetical protein D0Z00_003474 [Geotrichum candidum]